MGAGRVLGEDGGGDLGGGRMDEGEEGRENGEKEGGGKEHGFGGVQGDYKGKQGQVGIGKGYTVEGFVGEGERETRSRLKGR